MPSLRAPIAWVVPGHATQGLAGRAPDAPAAPAAARQAGDHIQMSSCSEFRDLLHPVSLFLAMRNKGECRATAAA
ncbi:hypothetical protein N9L68_06580 [bacterium]|nr:hypothetical protein [bacterium]